MALPVINGDTFFQKKPVKNKKAVSVLFLIDCQGKRELIKFSSIKRLVEHVKDAYSITLNRRKLSVSLQTQEPYKGHTEKCCYVISLYNEKTVKELSSFSLPSSKIKLTSREVDTPKENNSHLEEYLIVVPKLHKSYLKPFQIHRAIVSWIFRMSLIEIYQRIKKYKSIELTDCVLTVSEYLSEIEKNEYNCYDSKLSGFRNLRKVKDINFSKLVNSQYRVSIGTSYKLYTPEGCFNLPSLV